jgi:predicted transcriptional regulator
MARQTSKTTDLELRILQQIWALDAPSTVAAIIDSWPESDAKPGYTTILKTLQKMEVKGLVGHKAEGKRYEYYACLGPEDATENRLGTIIERMFQGNRLSFAQYFIEAGDFSVDELRELENLILEKQREVENDA